jgi:hypothetical protein
LYSRLGFQLRTFIVFQQVEFLAVFWLLITLVIESNLLEVVLVEFRLLILLLVTEILVERLVEWLFELILGLETTFFLVELISFGTFVAKLGQVHLTLGDRIILIVFAKDCVKVVHATACYL